MANTFASLVSAALRDERKPCPMCNKSPLAVFPNKAQQREIKQLRVRCPLSLPVLYQEKNSGRGPHHANAETQSDRTVKFDACSQSEDAKCSKLEDANLSKAVEKLKIKNINVVLSEKNLAISTEQVESKCLEQPENVGGGTLKSVAVRDGASCDWIGALGQVEKHLLDVHGAPSQRIRRSLFIMSVGHNLLMRCPILHQL